ncbi:MAG TPA: hypothetical protein VKQ32_10840 [Polyangia bacterium]|nr:hypothetical protein [Polyangia bacterium]
MTNLGKTTLKVGLTVGFTLGAIVGLVGCADQADDAENHELFGVNANNGVITNNGVYTGNGVITSNGINSANGINSSNGIVSNNGVMTGNGVSTLNGVNTTNGISDSSGYITTDAGRKVLGYLIRCALPSGHNITKAGYTFYGGLGLCPAWENGSIAGDAHCQNLISACFMAHINTSGVHVPLWLASESSTIGWSTDTTNYPYQEGTFFGNIMTTGNLSNLGMPNVTGPAAYFCEGAGISAGVVAGRLTVGAMYGAPYSNPYGTNVKCQDRNGASGPLHTNAADYTTNGVPNGYKTACSSQYCWQNGETITVWRNPNYSPVFDTVYNYTIVPQATTTSSMDTDSNGNLVQLSIPQAGPGPDQKFQILRSNTTHWKVVKANDHNKCAMPKGRATINGTQMSVVPCDGTPDQDFDVTANANNGGFALKHVPSGRCLEMPYNQHGDGAAMDIYDCWNGTNQLFGMKPSYN